MLLSEFVKVKVCIYKQSRYPHKFSRLYITYPKALILNLSVPREYAVQLSAAEAIHTVPIFVPPSTHCCWVDWGGVDSKLAQGFFTWPTLWESNPRPLDLGSNALTTRPHASICNNVSNCICWWLGYYKGLLPCYLPYPLRRKRGPLE